VYSSVVLDLGRDQCVACNGGEDYVATRAEERVSLLSFCSLGENLVLQRVAIGGKGDEGAWAPNLDDNKALDVVAEAAEDVSDELGVDVRVGLDVASSTLWDEKDKSYVYRREGTRRSPSEQIDYILDLIRVYRLVYVEDPLHEEDFDGRLIRT
jgi:enolase